MPVEAAKTPHSGLLSGRRIRTGLLNYRTLASLSATFQVTTRVFPFADFWKCGFRFPHSACFVDQLRLTFAGPAANGFS
jgi:hypothetical protein